MKLPGFVFLIIGIAVGVASWYLLKGGQKMLLFMYTGIAMAVYGAIRIYLDRGEPNDKEANRKELEAQLPSQRHHLDIPKICNICRTRNNPKANFCGYCGNRL